MDDAREAPSALDPAEFEQLRRWLESSRQHVEMMAIPVDPATIAAAAAMMITAGSAVTREVLRQRGETLREALRQAGETDRATLDALTAAIQHATAELEASQEPYQAKRRSKRRS